MDACVSVVATTVKDEDDASERAVSVSASQHSGTSRSSMVQSVASSAAKTAKNTVKNTGKLASSTVKHTGMLAKNTAKNTGKLAKGVAKGTVKTAAQGAKTTGAALLGAGKMASKATGTVMQRLNHAVTSPRPSSHFEDESLSDTGIEAEELSTVLQQQRLESELAERLAAQLEKERSRLAHASTVQDTVKSVAVVEDGSKLAPVRVFHKLDIETDTHPFFKRQWTIRHRLDETSPLLTQRARRKIAENDGHWPSEWNDHAVVRENLRFREIIVSFSGTANVSGSSVYLNVRVLST